MKMTLELSDQEARELKAALDAHLNEEERVVVRTDNPEFRHELVADFDVLERVRNRLAQLMGAGSQGAAAH